MTFPRFKRPLAPITSAIGRWVFALVSLEHADESRNMNLHRRAVRTEVVEHLTVGALPMPFER